MTRALPPTIALVDQTRTIPTADLAQVAGALGEQIAVDVEPIWHTRANVIATQTPGPYQWAVKLRTSLDYAGALGYHTDNNHTPVAYVDIDEGDWPSIVSHEVLEMLVDPWGSRTHSARIPMGIDHQAIGLPHESTYVHYLVEVCFPAGTKVMVPGGQRAIESMQVGDTVLDAEGHARVVSRAFCSGVTKQMTTVETYSGRQLTATPNHRVPAWVWPRECACGCGEEVATGRSYAAAGHALAGAVQHRWHPEEAIRTVPVDATRTSGGATFNRIPEGYEPQQDIAIADLRPGDYLKMPRTFDKTAAPESPAFARLLGYYAAEGCALRSDGKITGVVLSFSPDEHDTWAADASQIAESEGFRVRRYLYRKDKGDRRNVSIVHILGDAQRFIVRVGQVSHTKALHSGVERWPVEHKLEFLRGVIRGDGWRKTSRTAGAFAVTYVTTSTTLALQVEMLLAQLGYPSRRNVKRAYTADGFNRHPQIHVGLTGDAARDIARHVWGDDVPAAGPQGRARSWVDDNYVYLPVRKVTTQEADEPVYNITVAGAHTYLVEGIAVHNCDPCERTSYPVQGIQLSDFLHPSYYRTNPTMMLTYSHAGGVTQPRQVAEGGYVSFARHDGEWFQVTNYHERLSLHDIGRFDRQKFGSLREFTDHHAREIRSR